MIHISNKKYNYLFIGNSNNVDLDLNNKTNSILEI